MIYTVTISPAIDYVVHLEEMKPGHTNRSTGEEYYFGGKGINVSVMLQNMGIKVKTLGFVSGFTGIALEQGLKEQGLDTDFIHLRNGITRINVKVKSSEETEINSQGAIPTEEEFRPLFEKISNISAEDFLILSGSVPKGLPDNIYEGIMKIANMKGAKVILDTVGIQFVNGLKEKPFMVKPNKDELIDLFGNITPLEGAKRLKEMGAKNVIVSMGAEGAILLDENEKLYKCGTATGKVLNTVGSGDSMVAGFVAGYIKTNDYKYALQLGSAAGSATAFSPGLAGSEEIVQSLKEIREEN